MGKKILEIAKYVGAVTSIAVVVWFFYSFQDNVMDAIRGVDKKVNHVQEDLNEYKKTTNTHRVYKAEQNKKILERMDVFQRNQNAIINNSSEQKDILDEIKTQQLLNGTAHIEPVQPIEPEELTYNK